MLDNFIRDLQLLRKADSLIGRLWFEIMARRFGLFVLSGLVAVFGLGMTNIAGLNALQASVGSLWAAVIVAIADFVLAAIIGLVAKHSKPGIELELAFDARKTAVDALQADARDVRVSIDALVQEIRDVKDTVEGFVHNPLDTAVQNLLIPAATSIINGLRSKKDRRKKEAMALPFQRAGSSRGK